LIEKVRGLQKERGPTLRRRNGFPAALLQKREKRVVQ